MIPHVTVRSPRHPWAAAGPGRASRRRAERSSRRGRLAGGPPPTGAESSPARNNSARAAAPVTGRCTRSEEVHCLRIGCSTPNHKNKRGICETRARLRHPWAAAGPGRASRRRAEPKARGADESRAGRRPRAHKAARPGTTARGALHPIRRGALPTDRVQHTQSQEQTRNLRDASLAAAPVGGGWAWPDNEPTRRAKLAARTARGRADAHGRVKQHGPQPPISRHSTSRRRGHPRR